MLIAKISRLNRQGLPSMWHRYEFAPALGAMAWLFACGVKEADPGQRARGVGARAPRRHALGYFSPSAFHRAFKCWTGESPKEYRRLDD